MLGGALRAGVAGAGALVAAAATTGAKGPEVLVTVPGTGTPVGTVAREDGGFPFLSQAASDRTACMLDGRWVRLSRLRAIVGKARRDRDGAYADMVRATERCMQSKGWAFTPCGVGGGPACPATASGD